MISPKQKQVVQKVVQILQENNIPFQVTGGLAAIVYGARRPLYDVDIDVSKEDILKVREIFKKYIHEDFYHLQDEYFDIWLLTLNMDGIGVDISQAQKSYYINTKGEKVQLDADLTKTNIRKIDDIQIPVIAKEDLIAYKNILARETDLIDIEQINSHLENL